VGQRGKIWQGIWHEGGTFQKMAPWHATGHLGDMKMQRRGADWTKSSKRERDNPDAAAPLEGTETVGTTGARGGEKTSTGGE